MAASYNAPVGAGHAREQKGAGIGAYLVLEHQVARMVALCPRGPYTLWSP